MGRMPGYSPVSAMVVVDRVEDGAVDPYRVRQPKAFGETELPEAQLQSCDLGLRHADRARRADLGQAGSHTRQGQAPAHPLGLGPASDLDGVTRSRHPGLAIASDTVSLSVSRPQCAAMRRAGHRANGRGRPRAQPALELAKPPAAKCSDGR
jgi:hypothetical protein